jgi:hypothetical protein
MVGRSRPVDLLLQMPVLFYQPRVQRIAFGEILEVGNSDAGVEVVGAGFQNIVASRRTLRRNRRLKLGIEEGRLQLIDLLLEAASVKPPLLWIAAIPAARNSSNVNSGRNFGSVLISGAACAAVGLSGRAGIGATTRLRCAPSNSCLANCVGRRRRSLRSDRASNHPEVQNAEQQKGEDEAI